MNTLHQYLCEDRASQQPKLEITQIDLDWNDLSEESSHLIAEIISNLCNINALILYDNKIANL